MKKRSESEAAPPSLRDKIIGLGERSIRKSYFPQLQQQLEVVEKSRIYLEEKSAALLNMLEDLEEGRKKLAASEAQLRAIVETTPDCIMLIAADGTLLEVNEAGLKMIECESAEVVIGQWLDPMIAPEFQEAFRSFNESVFRGNQGIFQFEIIGLKGTRRWLETHAVLLRNPSDGTPIQLAVTRDITERKQAEKEIAGVNRALQMLNNTNQALIHIADEATLLTEVCRIAVEVGDYRLAWVGFAEHDEAKTLRPVAHAGFDSGYIESAKVTWADNERGRGPGGIAIRTGQPCMARNIPLDPAFAPWREAAIKRGYKSIIALPLISNGQTFGVMGIYSVDTDAFNTNEVEILKEMADDLAFGITALQTRAERELAEETLEKERKRMEVILSALDTGLSLINPDMTIAWTNQKVREMFPGREPVGQVCHVFYESRATICDGCGTLRAFKDGNICESEQLVPATGRWYYIISQPIKDKTGRVVSVLEGITNITERKRAEEALRNSELKYRNIFENAIEGIYQSTVEGRFITANAAFANMAGYDSPEEIIESIKDIGTQLYVHPEDRKRFLKIREEKGFVEGFEVEFQKKDGSTFWVVINALAVKDEQGKILYTEGLIEDITVRKHAEEQLQQTIESLRKAVGTTIQVLVSAVESRDPYTAGHQLRVANLACAIATEMGLSQEKIDGIRMAGSIHDVGKLSIPAEILSKPTKLTNIEFSLIKEHSLIGYEMLKNVESPWPLAQIVYQHHERMDGSGYPRNLKGDEIIMEARIMAMADVVEAMASHRPYRPGMGIEAALEEIEKNKGVLYDNAVADVCLRLFREKGYQFT
jgi:PAS domain S-box-containing protein